MDTAINITPSRVYSAASRGSQHPAQSVLRNFKEAVVGPGIRKLSRIKATTQSPQKTQTLFMANSEKKDNDQQGTQQRADASTVVGASQAANAARRLGLHELAAELEKEADEAGKRLLQTEEKKNPNK